MSVNHDEETLKAHGISIANLVVVVEAEATVVVVVMIVIGHGEGNGLLFELLLVNHCRDGLLITVKGAT